MEGSNVLTTIAVVSSSGTAAIVSSFGASYINNQLVANVATISCGIASIFMSVLTSTWVEQVTYSGPYDTAMKTLLLMNAGMITAVCLVAGTMTGAVFTLSILSTCVVLTFIPK